VKKKLGKQNRVVAAPKKVAGKKKATNRKGGGKKVEKGSLSKCVV
jgi:hypothetical protein